MDPTITVAVIAAAVSAFGWIANYILSSMAERRRNHLAARLTHIEEQLKVLYGPLAFLTFEGRRTFNDLLEKLGRKHVFEKSRPLTQDELDLWLYWVDHDFMPRNAKIKELLSSNTHLLASEALPNSYIEFLDHHNSWYVEHSRWKEKGIAYSWHSKINWPDTFEREVVSTFEKLMKEHALLIGTIGGARKLSISSS